MVLDKEDFEIVVNGFDVECYLINKNNYRIEVWDGDKSLGYMFYIISSNLFDNQDFDGSSIEEELSMKIQEEFLKVIKGE